MNCNLTLISAFQINRAYNSTNFNLAVICCDNIFFLNFSLRPKPTKAIPRIERKYSAQDPAYHYFLSASIMYLEWWMEWMEYLHAINLQVDFHVDLHTDSQYFI